MRYLLAAVMVACAFRGAPVAVAVDNKGHVLEAPDIVRVEVAGLPKDTLTQVNGKHLVRPDGTIGLGTYGNVVVNGLTVNEAQTAITKHLSQYKKKNKQLQVRVDIETNNSKFVYLIVDDKNVQVIRMELDAGDTVVNAVVKFEGVSKIATTGAVSVRRKNGDKEDTIINVDWRAITQDGKPETNVKLQPGDKIVVSPPAK